MWDLEASPPQAAIPRPSTPRQPSRFSTSNRPQRIQSRRERVIYALLMQRVLALENEDRMQSFPFRSTKDESVEDLHQEYVGERDFERDILMSSRKRRSNRSCHNP